MEESDKKTKKTKVAFIENYPYIKIDKYNKLEKQQEEWLSQMLMESVNSIPVEDIGKELNKFFVKILPENKEPDILKFIYSLSAKIRNNLGLKKNQLIVKHEEYFQNLIDINLDQNSTFSLTRELNEKLSFVLSMIYKNIKKKGKFNSDKDIIEFLAKSKEYEGNLIDKFQNKTDENPFTYMYSNSSYMDDNDDFDSLKKMNTLSLENNMNFEPPRISQVIQPKLNLGSSVSSNVFKNKENLGKKDLRIPLELYLLREKFQNIKIIKLNLKRSDFLNNNELLFEQNDIIYNIFILINLQIIFPSLIGIELDLSNEIILKDIISDCNEVFEKQIKRLKKNRKMTFYRSENKKRVFDVYKKKIFNSNNKSSMEDVESSDTISILNSMKENDNDGIKKKQEKFLNKHIYSLQMIIIYWYFIKRLENLKIFNFIIPINFEDKILLMLKESKITLFDFNIFAEMTDKLVEITLDFNSLDNKLFMQIIGHLFKNNSLTKINISFFPPEEYFEPRNLLNILNQNSKARITKKEINVYEDFDVAIIKKLIDNFEININKIFCYIINMPKLKEVSLVFDIPPIIEKVNSYELIILKLILNIFIYINNQSLHNEKSFKNITIISDNLNFDNRKYPFLDNFLESMEIYNDANNQIKSLTLKLKIFEINNLYKIIPYNVDHLSLGSFDKISFESFVDYITSSEFSIHSKIKYIQITLSNSIITLDDDIFYLLNKLLVEYPKNLEEICINTSLNVSSEQIEKLLKNTNYNKIEKISIQINEYNKEYDVEKTPKKNEINSDDIMDLYFIKKDEKYDKFKKIMINAMYKIGKKYNKDFMDYNIFSSIEKFYCNNEKKILFYNINNSNK